MATDYHRLTGFPDVEYITGTIQVGATNHARNESNNDQHGTFSLPSEINLTERMYKRHPIKALGSQRESGKTIPHVFEITVEDDKIVKLGARTNLDKERDLTLIVDPWNRTIITAWANPKTRRHHDFDREEYKVLTEARLD
jgi:hypothetical protein